MHSYLRAVGFSDIHGKRETDRLIQDVINSCDEKLVIDEGNNRIFRRFPRITDMTAGLRSVDHMMRMMNSSQSIVFRIFGEPGSPPVRM